MVLQSARGSPATDGKEEYLDADLAANRPQCTSCCRLECQNLSVDCQPPSVRATCILSVIALGLPK